MNFHLSMKREGDRIYLRVNLNELGYWTKEDFARFQDFGDKFWAGDFTELILPQLNPPEPCCAACLKRESESKDGRLRRADDVCNGEPLCDVCFPRWVQEERIN